MSITYNLHTTLPLFYVIYTDRQTDRQTDRERERERARERERERERERGEGVLFYHGLWRILFKAHIVAAYVIPYTIRINALYALLDFSPRC